MQDPQPRRLRKTESGFQECVHFCQQLLPKSFCNPDRAATAPEWDVWLASECPPLRVIRWCAQLAIDSKQNWPNLDWNYWKEARGSRLCLSISLLLHGRKLQPQSGWKEHHIYEGSGAQVS